MLNLNSLLTILILIAIIGAILFILFKVVTGSTLPNISATFDNSKNNSPIYKNSFNRTNNITIDKSSTTNNIDKSNHYYGSSPSTNKSSSEEIVILIVFTAIFAFMIYKKYYSYINLAFILIPFLVLIVYLTVWFICKKKNVLSMDLTKYMFYSLFLLSIVISFCFFPVYEPKNLNTLLFTNAKLSFSDSSSVFFITFKLIGSILQPYISIRILIDLIKSHKPQNKNSFLALLFMTVLCSLCTSGILCYILDINKF